MTSDGQRSYVIFLYADDLIEWTSGDDSSGVDAQVGFNAGDRVTFASVPGSLTDDIMDITTTSNVGIGGAWTFRVDQEEAPRGSCGPTSEESFLCLDFSACCQFIIIVKASNIGHSGKMINCPLFGSVLYWGVSDRFQRYPLTDNNPHQNCQLSFPCSYDCILVSSSMTYSLK